jgi:hypothetical protein
MKPTNTLMLVALMMGLLVQAKVVGRIRRGIAITLK